MAPPLLEALQASVLVAARHSPGEVAPAAILWPDADGQWQALVPGLFMPGDKLVDRSSVLRWTPSIRWEEDRGKEPERPKADSPGSGLGRQDLEFQARGTGSESQDR
jgi:hypothetical protein